MLWFCFIDSLHLQRFPIWMLPFTIHYHLCMFIMWNCKFYGIWENEIWLLLMMIMMMMMLCWCINKVESNMVMGFEGSSACELFQLHCKLGRWIWDLKRALKLRLCLNPFSWKRRWYIAGINIVPHPRITIPIHSVANSVAPLSWNISYSSSSAPRDE